VSAGTYLNPVYPRSCPDPFVLKVRGEYWCYSTGLQEDGRAFGILHSRDLVEWRPLPGALEPLPGGHTCYWAPEVVEHGGRFYLYYSVGNEEAMEIRAAVAEHPAGPFVDAGRRLTSEAFAIDAHVFQDLDGTRWLFYATDFLDRSHIGTGTVRDRLLDPFTLAGDPRPVALPRHDWHVYHPNRPEKGGVRWHTVEGPFVLARKGLYYEMFSGGNWQNPTYGVSYATTRDIASGEEWTQAADGERVLPVLRTTGEVVGPGHNSVVRGPDNRQLFCVYHRWSPDASARVLAIDPLDWAGERLLVLGPTTTPQRAPLPPTITLPDRSGEAWCDVPAPSFLLEASLRAAREIVLGAPVLLPGSDSFQRLRLEVDGLRATIHLDGLPFWKGRLEAPVQALGLRAGEISGFALTVGWEDLFLEECGWEIVNGDWRVEEGRLRGTGRIARGPALPGYELVVNARGEGWEIFPCEPGPRIALERSPAGWALVADALRFSLPEGFDPSIDQQFRFRKEEGRLAIAWEGVTLGEVEAPAGATRVMLGGVEASFEMVRVTGI
jgi:GH43 family beta-xylosidase